MIESLIYYVCEAAPEMRMGVEIKRYAAKGYAVHWWEWWKIMIYDHYPFGTSYAGTVTTAKYLLREPDPEKQILVWAKAWIHDFCSPRMERRIRKFNRFVYDLRMEIGHSEITWHHAATHALPEVIELPWDDEGERDYFGGKHDFLRLMALDIAQSYRSGRVVVLGKEED